MASGCLQIENERGQKRPCISSLLNSTSYCTEFLGVIHYHYDYKMHGHRPDSNGGSGTCPASQTGFVMLFGRLDFDHAVEEPQRLLFHFYPYFVVSRNAQRTVEPGQGGLSRCGYHHDDRLVTASEEPTNINLPWNLEEPSKLRTTLRDIAGEDHPGLPYPSPPIDLFHTPVLRQTRKLRSWWATKTHHRIILKGSQAISNLLTRGKSRTYTWLLALFGFNFQLTPRLVSSYPYKAPRYTDSSTSSQPVCVIACLDQLERPTYDIPITAPPLGIHYR
ncbi:hypothetical protein SODALDRAFT_354708 [Sodiomyces alkalinus F11]|uniref:Uncharacterized protein n=1 Tax=Sodiomyces alkalinus (strain CBS 110278 / VKM F-3762 / F11) TaxID=1314773 RepID=A0A3N2Q731_SODAK|nr:hypothetical protein SODALDRAFT_354708 [Sodiomyces alkalinus F11]ROT42552.1 hypothetical protein SODALDRAFT_354708 [Sodiomyces alkalinus F11]